MMKIKFSNIDCESLLKYLESQVNYSCENTFINHFKTVLKRKFNCGLIDNKNFIIWDYNFMLGAFYPVISGICDTTNNKITIEIKMNSFGKLLSILVLAGFGIAIFPSIFFNNNSFFFAKIILLLFFCFLPFMAMLLVYSYQRKKIVKELSNTITNKFSLTSE